MKRLAGAIAVAGAVLVTSGTAALASGVSGTEYTNASVNPVSGYQVNNGSPAGHKVTQVSSYIGSNNSHALAALPLGTSNGMGIQVCNPSTGDAIQLGIIHSGTNLMNVVYAAGTLTASTSNADPCQDGALARFTPAVGPVTLMAGVPINDTVNVQLTYDSGRARDFRGDLAHIGDWLAQGQVVGNGEFTTFSGGHTLFTRWVFGSASHNRYTVASFGTEANSASHLTPLSSNSVFLGAEAHMRQEYNSDGGNDYTMMNLPAFSQLLRVDSTSNGDAPQDGGVTYIRPSSLLNDAFNVFEGALVA